MKRQLIELKPSDLIEMTGWCRRNYAVNIDGLCCDIESEYAVAFCIRGAVKYCYRDSDARIEKVTDKIEAKVGMHAYIYNDEYARSQKEVVRLLRSVGE